MKGKVAANPKAHFRGFNFHPKVAKADGEQLWKPQLGWKTGKLEMEEKETIVSNLFIFSSNFGKPGLTGIHTIEGLRHHFS